MSRAILFFVGIFALLGGAYGATQTDEILYDYSKSIRLLDRDILNPAEKIVPIESVFEKSLLLVDKAALEKLSNDDVEDFFEISMTLSFYSHKPKHTRQMRRAFDEMAKRKLATPRMGRRMRDHYVASRMITDAREFASGRPEFKPDEIPKFIATSRISNDPTLWRLSVNGQDLTGEVFHLSNEAQVIVVSSPWCSFSKTASEAISKDSVIADLMKRHSTWILAQSMIPNFSDIGKWNRHFESWPLLIVDKNDDWPWVPSWETPGFYFMKNGQIVETVVGWPGPEQLSRLRDAFGIVGLAP